MFGLLSENWSELSTAINTICAVLSILVAFGFFVRRQRTLKDLIYVEQERDDLRKRFARAEARLDKIDPRRFEEAVDAAYNAGKFDKAEQIAFAFAEEQSPAFGKAAEILAEQRLLQSENGDAQLAQEAQRFAEIGLAAQPGDVRLKEIKALSRQREKDIQAGDPIEVLNWDGMSDVELNRLSISLWKAGQLQLAEVAARRSVPLALLRTGKMSSNYAAAIAQHAYCLQDIDDFDSAEPLYREALEITRQTLGEGNASYATRLNNFAGLLQATGRTDEAKPLFHEALEVTR
ncbi:tetratricopeptide repeat protein [Phaeobacter sp. HF9A]|uniref:tetratricopeptide repeat protein n=1 Tax=Phaeobacter sp. HF9A TaxID=2721561 RepID=UPI001430CC5B|nr:tetratricopeptide repeat protein [Phaeobacter sp. HF9A]NIZ15767.1 tetratricopeptide repeat protein [Phaeobacter sp. HF9A]